MSFLLQALCSAASHPLHSPLQVKDWVAKGVMAQVLRYHMVGCASLLYKDLTAITNVTSLQGDLIHISYSQVTKHGDNGNRTAKQSTLIHLFKNFNGSLSSSHAQK